MGTLWAVRNYSFCPAWALRNYLVCPNILGFGKIPSSGLWGDPITETCDSMEISIGPEFRFPSVSGISIPFLGSPGAHIPISETFQMSMSLATPQLPSTSQLSPNQSSILRAVNAKLN